MAPLDWNRLMQLQVNDLAEDEQRADDLYEVLGEFELGVENDMERVRKLFEVTQAIMLVKGTQAMVAEEELANTASQQGKSTAKRDQEIEDLKQQLKYQTKKIKDLEMYGSEEAGRSGGARDTRFLRDELDELEHQGAQLQRELKDKERQLLEERQISDRYITRAEDAERELRDLRRENENMHEDIRDYQRQLEAQRETMVTKRDEDAEYHDRLKNKNRLLSEALDENKNLAMENEELLSKIEMIKQEMRDGKGEIEKTTDDYLKLKLVVQQSDQTIVTLQRENEVLRHQLDDMLEQLESGGDKDDKIIVQVNRKVEEWKTILADKDSQVVALHTETAKLKAQLLATNMDDDKRSLAALTKGVAERDKQIVVLEKKLSDAVGDMETNMTLMEDVRADIRKGAQGSGESQQERITNLLKKLQLMERCLHDTEQKSEEAERDARSKDRQLSEALEKMHKYEEGIYGLPEAVAEIKELKLQVTVRERQIEELTQYINKCEMKINDLFDEVEELRERVGLDPKEPIDLGEFRKKKSVRTQEAKALNQVLHKEIERLEEERVSLKQDIRKLAQATGQRALTLGLSVDDVVAVDSFIDDLKCNKTVSGGTGAQIKSATEVKELKLRNSELLKEVDEGSRKQQRVTESNTQLKVRLRHMEEENRGLEKGMREIHSAIKEHQVDGYGGGGGAGGGGVLECPALEQMLAAMETRSVEGKFDTLLSLKSKVSNLQGHNDELRSVLREVRYEATKARVELEKNTSKVEVLESELKALKQAGAGAFFQTMALPEGMSLTSSDIIASLNEHLTLVLQEVSLKEAMLEKLEAAMETYRRKFAIARHQMGLLYQDHNHEKQLWREEQEKLTDQVRRLDGASSEDQVRIQEFDRLVETLGTDDVEVRRRLSELTRKVTVLRVNEKALTRRYTSLQEVEGSLRKAISRLNNEMIAMETAVAERLGYLQRYKDMASFKTATLQKQLDTSVPAEDLELANRRYTDLTEKYRDLLGKSNMLVARTEESSGYEVEMKRLQNETNMLKKELEIEKEKLHTLEAAFDSMKGQGFVSSKDLKNSEILSISKKMTTLEMKELNERQRAQHAVRMYDMQKQQLRDLEDRNFELEQKFSELTRMHLESQKVERELRDELSESVTREVSDADRRRLTSLEQTEAALKMEVSKLKDVAEVASCQVRAFETHQESRDKEIMSLRQQLVDFQAQSDEKTVIGKLHRQIVQMQVSEGIALKKLDDSANKTTKLDAQLLRTEARLDEKDETIYHNRMESGNKARHLKHTIHNMRMKYAGAVPLKQQESFATMMVKIQEDKVRIEGDLRQTNDERLKIEDRLDEVEVQHKGLQELIATLKDGRGAQKVAEWQNKMEVLRLVELRHKREISRLKEQLKFNETVSRKHEMEVMILEEEKVKLEKCFESRELEWDRREVELERIIESMERQQAQIAGAASQFEQAVSSLPDPNWPVPQQLEHAVSMIRSNVKLILDTRAEAAVCRKRMEECEHELRDVRREVLNRDKVITQLRLRMPATADREKIFASAVAAVESSERGRGTAMQAEDLEEKQAVRVAASTVASLQARLNHKDETLHKYQELLHQARDDAAAISRRYEEELKQMQAKLHDRNDAAFAKFKQAIQTEMNKPVTPAPTNKQLRRLEQLEDIVSEQDLGVAALREKLQAARQETMEWKYKYEDSVRLSAEDRERLKEAHNSEMDRLLAETLRLKQVIDDKVAAIGLVEEDLANQKECNTRAPTSTMKRLVERLRNQLAVKEKQQQALSKALLDLRADMVTQAQDDVKANVDKASSEYSVQRLIEKTTRELHDQLEELEEQNLTIKKALKTRKEREASMSSELEDTKQELGKKESLVKRLREEKLRLDGEVEDLERKVERMSTMAKQKGMSQGIHEELDELRRRNRSLQEQLKRGRTQAEKPYESDLPQEASTAGSMVARWEENKKWQKVVERQKTRLKEKEEEIQHSTKSMEMLTKALERANRDKESLEAKLHRGSAGIIKQHAVPLLAAPPSGKELHGIEELRKHNFELEQELGEVKQDLMMGNEKAFEEQRLRNKFLRDKVTSLELQLAATQHDVGGEAQGGRDTRAEDGRDMEKQSLQKQVLKLSEENIELTFQLEQLKKTVPRLKERVADLQKYVEVLKTEKDDLQANDSSAQHSLSTGSNVRRIGESGRSTRELEKTIALLKKIVERSQIEMEQLRKSRSVVSNESLRDLQRENEGLKTQLTELRMKVGASLSDRYLSQQRGTAKIMTEHDRLRRELLQETEKNEGLRIQLKQQDVATHHLEMELCDARERLNIEGARREVNGSETKGWKSVVATRVYEGKLKLLEEELSMKSSQLLEAKESLRVASGEIESLRLLNDELMDKVRRLSQLPTGGSQHSESDTDLARDYQVAQLKIDNLERQKADLVNELQLMRDRSSHSSEHTDTTNGMSSKRRIYEKTLAENVELQTQLRTCHMDIEGLKREMHRLKKELSNFGPEFFEEIEDLKFNYRESLRKNVEYEERLMQLSKQFGVDVNIPL